MTELSIRPDEIRDALQKYVADYQPDAATREEVGTVAQAADGIARVSGLPSAMANELLEFEDGTLGLALNLDTREIGVVILGDFDKIEEGQTVRRTGEILSVPVGDAFMGRVVDPLGRGRDGVGALDATPAEDAEAVAERAGVLAICHDDDTRVGWLAAGEALSAMWLEAVAEGLGGVPVSLPVEEPEVREQLRSGVLGLTVQPQVLLRVGWPHTSTTRLPVAPRRPIDDVLVP